ncbi:GIY-YIG nuclease family protein [Burkholderia cenocepacia]|uniref:GIY-YIG nuclease family protein n=1 Tax=Burkholderia cenocepacia TaxID=95486 RepID=UPI00196B743B|nr:GIY-YIG nuclease family protein [Burkholderia cenocepacia]MBN3504288.1 GIY-YIG nuclease family protein [Burkholderia cenocepacia]MCO1397647.1 GIY-YIG nuclease family protein [Burkholderia cenocepacia]MCO1410220.1 GIY-YIG nuclease family protein [Burkholderia cenocepacia]UQN93956.1 GIY-YIG nuclease family protein [Burkholderia cenocepacia]UQO01103.1 GIY-YIG nuclease family protein [Burkholderia cenocepacia]
MSWFLYLIECADDSVYTGITTDVAARFDEHASGKGARYTRSRKPRAVLASFPLPDRSSASRAEYWVKRLTPAKKRELAAGLRTLESVLPAAVALDERGDTAGTKATARGRKKEPTENTGDAAKAAATEQVAGKKPKAGKVAGSATAAKTAKPAKGTPASKSKSTQSNQAAPDAKRAKADGNAAARKTSSRGAPVKKTGSPSSASSKRKVPATAGKPTASVRDAAASAPARRRPAAKKAAAATAPSVAPPRAKRAKNAPVTPPLPASPPARRKTARAKQNRAAS